jgi:hypothetical protein
MRGRNKAKTSEAQEFGGRRTKKGASTFLHSERTGFCEIRGNKEAIVAAPKALVLDSKSPKKFANAIRAKSTLTTVPNACLSWVRFQTSRAPGVCNSV